MSKFVVDINDQAGEVPVGFGGYAEPRKPKRIKKILAIVGAVLGSIVLVGSIGFYLYWQNLKTTPQYSLALIVDAAKRNDQAELNSLVDIDAVVDDFVPQITEKAVDMYGRGLGKDLIARIQRVAAPVMPAVKDRAREELPGAIRQKTAELGSVPFAAMVFGASSYLDINIEGDAAVVRSKLPEHDFEVKMKRSGDRWKIVAIKDDKLATAIAQRVGQEIIDIATNGVQSGKSKLGIKNINELLIEAEKIFR